MPSEVLDLMAKPLWLIAVFAAVLAVGVFVGMTAEQSFSRMRRKAWRETNRSFWDKKRRGDAANQLRIVMGADFTIRPVLNKGEARVFRELDRIVIDRNPAWQVMAQVSLGEILGCKDPEAYGCINSKRVDFLLMDGECQPRHAIEYQGSGHHQSTQQHAMR